MRHPFQRSSNDRSTVRTPFQQALVLCIEAYSRNGQGMSGRKLSGLLGKSANHISQMLNDGFVPSGQAILDMARVLELTEAERDRLIRAAMETKAAQRSRDQFWINETSRMLKSADDERDRVRRFLQSKGLTSEYEAWVKAADSSRGGGRGPARG